MFCPNCGKENPDGIAFCGGCGMSFGTPAPQAAPQPAPAAPVPQPAPVAPAPQAAPQPAPQAAPVAAAAQPQPQPQAPAKPKEPSSMLPFGQHFKNIFNTALHPVTAPKDVIPQYEKIGNALILAAIVIVVCALVGSISSVSTYLIYIAQRKAELSRRVFNDVYDSGTIAIQIVKYSVYPFIYYAVRTFGMAGLFTLGGLIVKENWSFSKLLAAASLAAAPAYVVSDFLGEFLGLIPAVRFGSVITIAAYIYYLLLLYEGTSEVTKLSGNKKAFVFIICAAIAGYVAGFFPF